VRERAPCERLRADALAEPDRLDARAEHAGRSALRHGQLGQKQGLLFAGTELGLFFTLDGGGKWIELSGGVPTIPFRDLAIQRRESDLVGATFGRGFYVFDDYSPLREVSERVLERQAVLFPVRDTWWYIPRRPLGNGEKASQGDSFYTAPNPPFGAVFTYHLAEGWTSAADERRFLSFAFSVSIFFILRFKRTARSSHGLYISSVTHPWEAEDTVLAYL
jgi:hypothetical protein